MHFNMSIVETDEAFPYRLRFGHTEIAKFANVYTLEVATASCSFSGASTLAEAVALVEHWTALEREHHPNAVVLLDPEGEETPAPAATDDEGKSLASNSTHRAYLAYLANLREGTKDTYGTWSGEQLSKSDHMMIVVSADAARAIVNDGPQLVGLHPQCVTNYDREVRKVRDEKRRKELESRRRLIRSEIMQNFDEELSALDAKVDAVYDEIDRLVDARMTEEGEK